MIQRNDTLHGVIAEEPVGVHAGSIGVLSAAVDDLLVDPDRRHAYGTAGCEHVVEAYAFTSVVDADR